MTRRLLAALAALAMPGTADADVLTYAGYLLDAAGRPVPVATAITFRFYPEASGGTVVWADTVTVLPNADGWFSAVLGASAANPLDAADFGQPLWLALQVATDAQEMAPRTRLGSAPSALTIDWAGVAGKPATFPVDPTAVQRRVTGSCGPGQFITGVSQDGGVSCADGSGSTYTAGAGISIAGTTVSLAACPADQVLKSTGAGWSCQADASSTYGASLPISLTGTTFALSTVGCVAGEVWKYNGNAWSCDPDADTYTIRACTWATVTGSASATSLAVACPAGKYPISGGCAGAGTATVRIGRPGGPPANGAAWSTVTQWSCEFSAAAVGHMAYALCCNN